MHTALRRAQDGDEVLLLTFMEEYYRFECLPFDRSKAAAALNRLLRDESMGSVWFIEAGTASAGYVVLTLGYSMEYHGRDAFIDEIYLREAFRGNGVGRAALALVADAARSLGVNALHLEVERANRAAQAFYRKSGYEDHDRYLMTRRLAGGAAESPQ